MSIESKHPSEEQLMEYALGKGDDRSIAEHCASCSICKKEVENLKEAGKFVQSINDEDIPDELESRILNRFIQRNSSQGILQFLSSPFFIALLVIFMVIILWFLVGTNVLK